MRLLVPVRAVLAVAGVVALAAGVAACAPEPSATATISPTATKTATPSPTSASASPTPSASPSTSPTASADPSPSAPDSGLALPAACEAIYSGGMLETLQTQLGPLNDPEVGIASTRLVAALEVLESGIPTVRCTWGSAGRNGLATNVSIVDGAQSQAVLDALASGGFGCEQTRGGTLCRIETETVDFSDTIVRQGEAHFLRDDGWISTAWITTYPDGYTEDIVDTLWG